MNAGATQVGTIATFEMDMPSGLAGVETAVSRIRTFLESSGWDGQWYALHLVLRELLLNAVRHAEHVATTPGVGITVRLMSGGGVELVVNDHGQGWDWAGHEWTLPDTDKTAGRGLFLVRCYCDSLHFNKSGNTVTIRLEPRES